MSDSGKQINDWQSTEMVQRDEINRLRARVAELEAETEETAEHVQQILTRHTDLIEAIGADECKTPKEVLDFARHMISSHEIAVETLGAECERAKQAEAERDEALAQVAMLLDRANTAQREANRLRRQANRFHAGPPWPDENEHTLATQEVAPAAEAFLRSVRAEERQRMMTAMARDIADESARLQADRSPSGCIAADLLVPIFGAWIERLTDGRPILAQREGEEKTDG